MLPVRQALVALPLPASQQTASMDFNNHQYGGGDDCSLGSRGTNQSSIGMASSGKMCNDESFTTNADQFNLATQNNSENNTDNLVIDTATDDALTVEAANAVTKERQLLYKENAGKLQTILENIKNSTKNTLKEMDIYLQETEEVEKTYIRCRANTQKESQRMEQVEPDVISATQRKFPTLQVPNYFFDWTTVAHFTL